MGMEKIIVLGARRSGSFDAVVSPTRMRIGDLVMPGRAISEEGTSQHYPIVTGPFQRMKPQSDLEEASEGKEQPFLKAQYGRRCTVRETPAKVRPIREGRLSCRHGDVRTDDLPSIDRPVDGLLVVSDELFDLKCMQVLRS